MTGGVGRLPDVPAANPDEAIGARGARRRGSVARVAALVLLGLVVAAGWSFRVPILRAVGWALIAQEQITPADIVIVAIDSGGAGVLEAADLVRDGIARRVGVFQDPPSGDDHEFIRRGLPYEDAGAIQTRQLRALGVEDIVRIPIADAGTTSEGLALPAWCEEQGIRSVVFVATADHSRRLRRVLDRLMNGSPVRIVVRPTRYSRFDPDTWWQTRMGLRIGLIEIQKLVLDFARHPFS